MFRKITRYKRDKDRYLGIISWSNNYICSRILLSPTPYFGDTWAIYGKDDDDVGGDVGGDGDSGDDNGRYGGDGGSDDDDDAYFTIIIRYVPQLYTYAITYPCP